MLDDTIKTCMYMNAGNQDYTNKGNCDYQPPLEVCHDNTYSCKYTLQFSPPSSEMSGCNLSLSECTAEHRPVACIWLL